MANIFQKQLAVIKKKFIELASKHKSTVQSLKERYEGDLKKATVAAVKYKKFSVALKKKLEREKELSQKNSTEQRTEILYLQGELQRLRARSMVEDAQDEERKKQYSETEEELKALKDAAYAKAQIDSLKEELKNEIAKSSKLTAASEARIVALQEQLSREKESVGVVAGEKDAKIHILEEFVKKEKLLFAEMRRDLNAEITTLMLESERLREDLYEKRGVIENFIESVTSMNETIENQEEELEVKRVELGEYSKVKNEEIRKLVNNIKGLKNQNQKLFNLTRTYDVFQIYDDIKALKIKTSKVAEEANQKKLKELMFELGNEEKMIREFEKKVIEKLANFDNEMEDMEEKIKNKTYDLIDARGKFVEEEEVIM
ncbi:MAG: hypothetical protein HQK49_11960 [Oligoflexia bacterium]|nr:hypothetical protein [Oligoflexia bacterium]